MDSLVRLGVSPAAASTPWVFSIRGLRLYFPALEPWVVRSASIPRHSSQFMYVRMWGRGVLLAALPALFSATLSPALWVYLCANVGLQGLLMARLPALFIPHSASLSLATATRVLSALPARLCPSDRSG